MHSTTFMINISIQTPISGTLLWQSAGSRWLLDNQAYLGILRKTGQSATSIVIFKYLTSHISSTEASKLFAPKLSYFYNII